MDTQELIERASARRYAYQVFQRLTGDEPTQQALGAIDAELLRMAFEVVGADTAAADALAEALAGAASDAGLESVRSEYMRVFVGPASLPAPPWESVYRDHKRVVMTVTTLSVREAYHACGFAAAGERRVPDDHLAIELDFLASLAAEALDAAQAGNEEKAQLIYDAGTTFAREHLGAWAPAFAADVRENANAPFYATAAAAVAAFVKADAA